MGKAKWWVCEGCHSLNDLPANKCFSCHEPKPSNPRTLDDEYSEVGSQQRVGITVDLAKVGDLTNPDPIEADRGGGFIEAFAAQEDQPSGAPAREPYDPYAAGSHVSAQRPAAAPQQPPVPPLREPVRRGIDQLGGAREWADASVPPEVPPPAPAASPVPDQAPQPQGSPPPVPPPAGAMPPAGSVPPPGQDPADPTGEQPPTHE